MKGLLSSRGLFVLGLVVLLATNVAVLLGVASNRSGEPEAVLLLTERELNWPYRIHKEDSGLALQLAWRAIGKEKEETYYVDWRTPEWFDGKKLKEVGFDVEDLTMPEYTSERYKVPVAREVLIVLEYDGEPYKEAVRRAETALEKATKAFELDREDEELGKHLERAEKRLEGEEVWESRLFAIDAGLDAARLRQKYRDPERFIITPAVVEPTRYYGDDEKELQGYISWLSVGNINVPLTLRRELAAFLDVDKSRESESRRPRYTIELAYGKRLEPWIRSVGQIKPEE
ncbi:MAG: DUF4824 family protein [Thermodesulfobacteriota bacterium]|nr:DUF4824 family protein [Thermodesulfobacteriota bacterium]